MNGLQQLPEDPARARLVLAAAVGGAGNGAGDWVGTLRSLVDRLATVGAVDLALGRLVEGHADALRILDQAGSVPAEGVHAVWASRSAGTGLSASPHANGWHLTGELRFASGVDLVDHALVTARLEDGHDLLCTIPAGSVQVVPGSWATAAMASSRSFTVLVDEVVGADQVVGPLDFYLDRPGFVVGGLGPAAVWVGGADAVVDLVARASAGFDLTPHQHRRLGEMEQAVWTARTALRGVADGIDEGRHDPEVRRPDLVDRARTAVALACDTVLAHAPVVVGPGGLTRTPGLDRTLHDLGLYVRQHHLDQTLARAGAARVERSRA